MELNPGGNVWNGYSGMDLRIGISSLEFPPVKLTFVKGEVECSESTY
jgi:hypothetical protein